MRRRPAFTARAPGPAPAPGRFARLPVAARAAVLAVGCGLVYLVIAGGFRFEFTQTQFAHHIFMADAMLHGQLHIRPEALAWKQAQLIPGLAAEFDRAMQRAGRVVAAAEREARVRSRAESLARHDWAAFQGREYGYWGPLTPVVVMPFVALFGLGVSDQLINVLMGALNVGLFYWLLWRVDRSGLCAMSEACRVALAIVLALGTSHFWMTCAGQVWFAIQIITLTFLLLAMIAICAADNRVWRWLLAGACFGAAILGRSSVIFLGLFFIFVLWSRCRRGSKPLGPFVLRATVFGLPLVAALGVQGWYNYARFGDMQQSGLDIQIRTQGNPRFLADYEEYGAFSLHYLPKNFKHYFWNCYFPRRLEGRLSYDPEGNSVFLMTPPLLYIFLVWRRWSWFAAGLLAGVVPLVIMLLLFNGTGWVQFGPRYLLDATPMLLLLAAIGMRGRLTRVSYVLCVLAVAVQFFGVSRICAAEFGAGQAWVSEWTLGAAIVLAIAAGIGVARWRRVAA